MPGITSQFISTLIQIVVVTLIPFCVFVFAKNKTGTFIAYIGLYRPTAKAVGLAGFAAILFLIAAVGAAFLSDGIKESMLSPHSITGQFRQMGLNANSVCILLMISLFKTAFAEEIFFRGFIAKRLISKYGFSKGNMLQAIIFGLVHLLLFWLVVNTSFIHLAFIFTFTTIAAGSICYINEKLAKGSIIPGWIAHGLGNALGYFVIAFMI